MIANELNKYTVHQIVMQGFKMRGVLNMTLKPEGRVRNGTRHSIQDRTRVARTNKKSRQ
jgi:hypothetical protein